MEQNFVCNISDFLEENSLPANSHLLLFVITGELKMMRERQSYHLKQGDVVFLPAFYRYSFQKCTEFQLLTVRMLGGIRKIIPGWNPLSVRCNSTVGDGRDYAEIRSLCAMLALEYDSMQGQKSARQEGLLYFLVDLLMRDFCVAVLPNQGQMSDERKLSEALTYIHEHYTEEVTLHQLGDILYMSPSVCSRYLKKELSMNVSDYILNLRIQKACRMLVQTEQKVVDIALDCGFLSVSSFNKCFKRHKNMTPSAYRLRGMQSQTKEHPKNLPQIDREALKQLAERDFRENSLRSKVVVADVSEYRLFRRPWNKAINIGAARELLSGEYQKHVLVLKRELQFEYVRMLNVFSEELYIRNSVSPEQINFRLLDSILDFLVENEINVILDLGNQQKEIMNEKNQVIYRLYDSPVFYNLKDFAQFVEIFLEHVIRRYGYEKVEQWIFDISYERDCFVEKENYTFLEYCDTVMPAIKKHLPSGKVCIHEDDRGMKNYQDMLQWTKLSEVPDFISCGTVPFFPMQLPDGKMVAKRSRDKYFLKRSLQKLREQSSRYLKEMTGTKQAETLGLIATEWNINISDRNFLNDTQEFAAQLLDMINLLLEDVDLAVFTYGSDLSIMYYETAQSFFGGKGLISKDGILKPSCYALSFYRQLEKYLVLNAPGYLLSCNGTGVYTILCYNAKAFSHRFYQEEEEGTLKEQDDLFADNDLLELEFHLNNVKNGSYTVKNVILEKENSVYVQWHLLGCQSNLTKEEIAYLNRVCVPRIKNETCEVSCNSLFYCVQLKPHEIRLITMAIS